MDANFLQWSRRCKSSNQKDRANDICLWTRNIISDRRHPFLNHLQHVINRYFVIFKMSINQKILQNIYRCRVKTNKKWMHLKAWFSSYRNVIKKNLSLKQNVKDLKNNEIFYPFNSYSSHHSATCENNIRTENAFFQKDWNLEYELSSLKNLTFSTFLHHLNFA